MLMLYSQTKGVKKKYSQFICHNSYLECNNYNVHSALGPLT